MFRSYRIGSMFGFPIEVNLSFLLLLAIVPFIYGGLAGLAIVLIAFASVLLHELGHALMARHLGVHIAGIELHFFGGAAKMTSQPRTANDEVAIAAAGPAVSFALGGFGLVLGGIGGGWFFSLIGWLNIIIGAFNLVPALPMDGGRILRALLTRKYSFAKATETSVTIARGFAILIGVYGLASGQFFLPLLAVLLWIMGSAEQRMARLTDHQFSYDRSGYRFSGFTDEVEVLPRDYWASHAQPRSDERTTARGGFSFHRPRAAGGFVIRRRNGRLYIQFIE